MKEAHHSRLVHLGETKMYHDLRCQYWWQGMKRDIAQFVSKCLTLTQVKVEHQKPAVLLQPLPIVEWKWDHVTMDFVTRLPRTPQIKDSVWVIVDSLMKSTHFLAMRITDYCFGQIVCEGNCEVARGTTLLFQIENLDLHRSFGIPYKKPWELKSD